MIEREREGENRERIEYKREYMMRRRGNYGCIKSCIQSKLE